MKKIYLTLLFALSLTTYYAQCPVQVQVTPATCFGLCNGTAMAFGSGGGPYTYSWLPGGQTTQTISGLCAGTYSVYVLNAVSCLGQAVATITQPSQLNLVVTGQNPNSCTNCNGVVAASASGGTSPYSYLWMPSNCTSTSCGSLCAGVYTCTVTDSHGCTASQTWTLNAPAPPAFGVTSTPATQPNCNNGTATVNLNNPGTYTFSWTPSSQTTQTATGLTGLSIYTVCVTNTGTGCSACQVATVNCITGIETHQLSLGAGIYPNPASGYFTLEFSGIKTGEMNIELLNVVGEVIYTEHLNVTKQFTKQIDVSSYPKGIYFVRIKGAEGIQTMKLIVD